jgi:hypothetical protein
LLNVHDGGGHTRLALEGSLLLLHNVSGMLEHAQGSPDQFPLRSYESRSATRRLANVSG